MLKGTVTHSDGVVTYSQVQGYSWTLSSVTCGAEEDADYPAGYSTMPA